MKKCIFAIAGAILAFSIAGCANDSDSVVSQAAAVSIQRNSEAASAASSSSEFTPTIYTGSSNDIKDGYFVVKGPEAFAKKYEYDTEAGVTYYVNWCDEYNALSGAYSYGFTNLPEGLADCIIYVKNSVNDLQITYTDDYNPISFIGTGGKVYIQVDINGGTITSTSTCAFRVYK